MDGVSKETMGLEISRANEALILSTDAVIANLTPFRGTSADVGTVYEVGMAKELRKVIVGYTHDERKFLQRNIVRKTEFVSQKASIEITMTWQLKILT